MLSRPLDWALVTKRAQNAARHFAVVERNRSIAQHLVRFVTFAGENDDVARTSGLDCRADGAFAIGLDFMRSVEAA